MRSILLSFIILFNTGWAFAADGKITRQDYISMWRDEAIYQMVVHKIPASITMAQGILESGDGNSRLAREGNNHFGIKCHQDWTGERIYEDDETKGECFRSYDNARDSYEDHSVFLQRKRYETLFTLNQDDYKGWAKGLKNCGYATNPSYPQLLIKIIEEFELKELDEIGLNHIRKKSIPGRPNHPKTPANIGADVAEPKQSKSEKNSKRSSRNDEERTSITISAGREIKYSDNNIRYLIARAGDTPQSIADDLDMHVMFIRKYNDLEENHSLSAGEIIYLQPKRNHAKENSHKVVSGDTLRNISQKYGIRLKKILKLNNLNENDLIKPGQVLKLKK
jgi:LysM repeat protein